MTIKVPALFFLGLSGIRLPLTGHPGLAIGGQLRITNDRAGIERLIGAYTDHMGTVEHHHLVHFASALVYARDTTDLPATGRAEAMNRVVVDRLREIQAWLMKLWLVKDNAVDPDIGWLVLDIDGDTAVNNNRWSTLFSRADGSTAVTEFTRDELARATAAPLDPDDFGAGEPVAIGVPGASDPRVTQLSYGSLRFQRFLYFVNAARGTKDVAIKIALYCSGLEAIVSTSHAELTHQVSERAAILLRRRGEERLAIFRDMKSAYGMRSKAVHGAAFRDRDHEALIAGSIRLDAICREVALAYFAQDDFRQALGGNDENFGAFWTQKLFLD